MADKIVVLNEGRIEQVGSPLELYRKPDNLFVAGFIGSPKMNFITGDDASKYNAETIGIRPEHISLSKESGEWKAKVRVAEHLGSDTFLHVTTDRVGTLTVRATGGVDVSYGDQVHVTPDPSKIHRFDQSGATIT